MKERRRANGMKPKVVIPSGYKPCGQCKKVMAMELFGKSVNAKDGRQWRCKACDRESRRQQYPPPTGNDAALLLTRLMGEWKEMDMESDAPA